MGSAFAKNNLREIRHTLVRFLAILAIVALGVGFFAGLSVTRSAMLQTLDAYVRAGNMHDFRALSTLGFDLDAPAALARIPGVEYAVGGYALDAAFTDGDGAERLLKVLSISREVDRVVLTAGRMPGAGNECLADARYFRENAIGSSLRLDPARSDGAGDSLRYDSYTITGLANSVLYLNTERGTTRLGDGQLDGFLYLWEDGFNSDVYTELRVSLQDKAEVYSQGYDALTASAEPGVTAAVEAQAQARYQRLYGEARQPLDEARAELNAAREEYQTGLESYEREKAETDARLQDNLDTLNDAETRLKDGLARLEETEAALRARRDQVTEGLTQLDAGLAQLADSNTQLQDSMDRLAMSIVQLEAQLADPAMQSDESLLAQKAELDARMAALETQLAQLNSQSDALAAQKAQAQAGLEAIDAGLAEIAAQRMALAEQRSSLAQGWADYQRGKQEAEEALAQAEAELTEAAERLADGEAALAEGEAELAALTAPDCYVLGRDSNVGYACFDNDANIVAGVAKVFPPFFFLVAALVCVTTMKRMVDDQRTQIGVLKALGYRDAAIIRKYVSYAGSAALLGCLLGFFLGTLLFPKAIWMAYSILYGFSGIRYVFAPGLLAVSVAVALLCSVGTTWLACGSELRNSPAALMRPRAPKAGKRILLEHIPFLWRRMKFLHKVSARNILRYKKRLCMMVLGIAGCTALVLTGFGINDSVCDIVDDQFIDIMGYDYAIAFADGLDADGAAAFLADSGGMLDECVFVNAASAELDSSQGIKSVNVLATDNPAGLTALIDLHLGEQAVSFPGDGEIVVSAKLADFAGVGVGDRLTLRLDGVNSYSATVSGICENYVFHYAYMNAASYTAAYGRAFRYNQALATVAEGQDEHAVAAALLNGSDASTVSVVSDLRDRVDKMMDSMSFIVWLVIACAGALAFIVLCNLSNINISERVREIATIKVLGFYPGEVGAYVFRENFVLTAVGALLGLPLGVLLHRFVMSQLKIDMVSFPVRIYGRSYVYAVALTFAFTLITDLIMRRKLNAISMTDSLKSVE